jgi:hypothetical protein
MMKNKLLIPFIISLFVLCSCNNDRIELAVTSPKDDTTFFIDEAINVNVTATTQKGRIIQVQLEVQLDIDEAFTKSLTAAPYNFYIPPQTFKKGGIYTISIVAYSSKGVMAGDGVRINIK